MSRARSTLPRGMVDAIERYLQSAEARVSGLKSRSDVVVQAVRRLLEDEDLFERRPRLMHFDTYQDHVMIVDNELGRMAGVYFKLPDKAYCDPCEAWDSHIRIDFVLTLEEVAKTLEKAGFKVKEVREDRIKELAGASTSGRCEAA